MTYSNGCILCFDEWFLGFNSPLSFKELCYINTGNKLSDLSQSSKFIVWNSLYKIPQSVNLNIKLLAPTVEICVTLKENNY